MPITQASELTSSRANTKNRCPRRKSTQHVDLPQGKRQKSDSSRAVDGGDQKHITGRERGHKKGEDETAKGKDKV